MGDQKGVVGGVQWTDFVHEVMLTYNNKIKQSATGFTPSDAKKKANETDVRLNLLNKKKHDRRYPLLSIGDKVKINRKKERIGGKGKDFELEQ